MQTMANEGPPGAAEAAVEYIRSAARAVIDGTGLPPLPLGFASDPVVAPVPALVALPASAAPATTANATATAPAPRRRRARVAVAAPVATPTTATNTNTYRPARDRVLYCYFPGCSYKRDRIGFIRTHHGECTRCARGGLRRHTLDAPGKEALPPMDTHLLILPTLTFVCVQWIAALRLSLAQYT